MNYRSVPEILHVANAAISANIEQFRKNLGATRNSNAVRPAVVALNDGAEQAQFVAQRILELRDENINFPKIAFRNRAHYQPFGWQWEWPRPGIPIRSPAVSGFSNRPTLRT